MLRLVWSKDREMEASNPDFSVISREDAVEIGYEIGCNLRIAGAGKSLELKNLGRWLGDKSESPDFSYWRHGFRAGYRGLPKPVR